MADNLKLSVRALYSKNTDYSSPKVDFNPSAYALTPDEYLHMELNCDTGGESIDTARFTTVTLLIVKNNDTAINVVATFSTDGGTLTDMSIPAGSFMVLPNFNPANDLNLKSASGTPECEVLIVGT